PFPLRPAEQSARSRDNSFPELRLAHWRLPPIRDSTADRRVAEDGRSENGGHSPGQSSVVAGGGRLFGHPRGIQRARPAPYAPEPSWWGERTRRLVVQRHINHKGSRTD